MMYRDLRGIKIYAPEEFFPSERAVAQLERISRDERVEKPVIGLVDIHDKKDNDFPTGVVVASRKYIFPQLVVSGPNCGMRMMSLPLSAGDMKDGDVDRLFRGFSRDIHLNSFFGSALSEEDIMGIMRRGAGWIKYRFPDAEDEIGHIESGGNAFGSNLPDDRLIRRAIPKSIRELSKYRMGILGKGNHFLELQEVEEVFDQQKAEHMGLRRGGLYLFMHSGSGGLGAMAGNIYTPRSISSRGKKMSAYVAAEWFRSMFDPVRRRYIKKVVDHIINGKKGLFGLEAGSEEAELYLTAIRASANFAYANRAFISRNIRRSASESLGIEPKEIKTLYDLSHMSIEKETYGDGAVWVHRTGGVRALPPGLLPEGSVFKETGTPVFLPGSMGSATYIGVATEKNKETFYSVSHGTGRLPEDKIKARAENREELVKYLKERSITLYKGEQKRIVKQDPRCFKDVDKAAGYLEDSRFLKKVAKMRPIAVLKG